MSDGVKKTKKCFIISAIGEQNSDRRKHFLWLMSGIIKPALSKFPEYKYLSSFDIHTPGIISNQIVSSLLDDDLVIADMTFLNANVFYEMGIRHHRGKAIIHMMRKNPDYKIPFDVNQYRTIEYDMEYPTDLESASIQLANHIAETHKPDYRVSNPVTQVRENLEIAEKGTDIDKALLERIETIEDSIASLRQNTDNQTVKRGGNLVWTHKVKSMPNVTFSKNNKESSIVLKFERITENEAIKMISDFCEIMALDLPKIRWISVTKEATLTFPISWNAESVSRLIETLLDRDNERGYRGSFGPT